MRILLSLSLLVLLAAPGMAAAKAQVERIDIVAAGLFKSQLAKKVANPESATGLRGVIKSEKLLRQTTDITAKMGVEFGVRYRLVGKPKGARVPVKIVTIYPGEGLRNPATGKTTMREELTEDRTVGRVSYEAMTFEHDWELAPGTWSFEFWYDGKKLAEQKFTVTKP